MVNRVFIYGEFRGGGIPTSVMNRVVGRPNDLATEAIEILREFSPNELIGKIYVLTQDRNYLPVTPYGVGNYTWYKEYKDAAAKKETIRFAAKGGDSWQVLWMRQESDDSGPYIAAALKHD